MPVPQNYAFHNIWFEAFRIAVASILLYKQFSVFHEDKVQRTFTKILFIQIAYFASFIVRVLIDVAVLPKTQISVYAINIINFGLFATCSWFVFSYLELYQNAKGFSVAKTHALYAIPYLCNVAILLSSPWTHAYIGDFKKDFLEFGRSPPYGGSGLAGFRYRSIPTERLRRPYSP